MVHGVCSSAGCFSMTDAQIAEIYAIAREAFNGGQRAIQMQSFPFRMTAENLAKHRLDPNIAFWKEIKNGADHFEVTKAEPEVLVCGKHYVFGAHSDKDVDASAPCPADLQRDDQVEAVGHREGSAGRPGGGDVGRARRQAGADRLSGRRPERRLRRQGRRRQRARSARRRADRDHARQFRQAAAALRPRSSPPLRLRQSPRLSSRPPLPRRPGAIVLAVRHFSAARSRSSASVARRPPRRLPPPTSRRPTSRARSCRSRRAAWSRSRRGNRSPAGGG